MISSYILVDSFAYMTIRETDFLGKRLGVAPYDPNMADVGVHSFISERYAKKVISEFNFLVGIEIVIPRRRDVASLCPLGFSATYVDQSLATMK